MIWCPKHPHHLLAVMPMPSGKIDLRCPACTRERVDGIKLLLESDMSGRNPEKIITFGNPENPNSRVRAAFTDGDETP